MGVIHVKSVVKALILGGVPKENVYLDKSTRGRILRPKSVPQVEREKAIS